MRMNPSLWFVQWFFWSCRVLDRFFCRNGYGMRTEKYKNGTNICHFFRTLLWGMIITLGVVAWYLWLAFVVLLPFILFRISSLGMVTFLMICVVAVIGIIVATIYGICTLVQMYADYAATREAKPDNGPSFTKMTYLYLKAWKERYCLIIEFKPEGDA